jgi:CBS-domain-containing membrane protein
MKTAALRLLLVPSATTFDRPRHHPPAFRMRDKEVRRFPVFNKEGRLVGLLSLSDFAGQADQEYTGGTANRQVTDAEVAALDHTAHMPRPIDASRSLTNSFFR